MQYSEPFWRLATRSLQRAHLQSRSQTPFAHEEIIIDVQAALAIRSVAVTGVDSRIVVTV